LRRYWGTGLPEKRDLSRLLTVEEPGRELYEAAQRLDLEGIVAKPLDLGIDKPNVTRTSRRRGAPVGGLFPWVQKWVQTGTARADEADCVGDVVGRKPQRRRTQRGRKGHQRTETEKAEGP
jgi:hypothetical protein